MEWLPGVSALTVSVAVPLLSDTVPSTVVPSLKVSVPVELDGATVATNVTGDRSLMDVADADKVVVVATTLTAKVAALLVLASCVPSP